MSEDYFNEGNGCDTPAIEGDFNVADDYKPEPLIPPATYHASVTNVTFNPQEQTIVWTFCLNNNGGYLSDGETPVDGAVAVFKNWLPRPVDKKEMSKNGKSTKWQSKINMLHQFAETLGIEMKDGTQILGAIADNIWIGMEVDIDVNISEWQGRFRNDVNKVKKSTI